MANVEAKMRYWIPMVMAAAVASLVLAGCSGSSTAKEDSWSYVGTWVNSAYNGQGGGPPAKLVLTSATVAYYNNDFDAVPMMSGTFAATSDWTSGGAHYFKGVAVAGSTFYFLIRVANANNTLECNSGSTSYPATIDPAGSNYGIFARQ